LSESLFWERFTKVVLEKGSLNELLLLFDCFLSSSDCSHSSIKQLRPYFCVKRITTKQQHFSILLLSFFWQSVCLPRTVQSIAKQRLGSTQDLGHYKRYYETVLYCCLALFTKSSSFHVPPLFV